MSTNTQTIRVRILPGIRMWQALVVAAAIVASLMLGLLIGRSNAPASAATTIDPRDFSRYACTSHVPNIACPDRRRGVRLHGSRPGRWVPLRDQRLNRDPERRLRAHMTGGSERRR